jgi:hypothetical protein
MPADIAAYGLASQSRLKSADSGRFISRDAGTRVAHGNAMAKSRKRPEDYEGMPGAPQSAGDTTAGSPDRDRVAQRAYELYLARGGADGADLDDWLNAERELANGGSSREDS